MGSKMFPFITHTWNPLCGECPHNCKGCWAKAFAQKRSMEKYRGAYRIDNKQIDRKFPKGSFVFVCDMLDLFAGNVPLEFVALVLQKIKAQPDATFLLLTRNPRYLLLVNVPSNCVVGATIDTNRDYALLTDAPMPVDRLAAMSALKLEGARLFVSVEPIKDFDPVFVDALVNLKPWGVAVGYDNYGNGFPEPELAQTLDLICRLEAVGVVVFRKTLREPKTVQVNKL